MTFETQAEARAVGEALQRELEKHGAQWRLGVWKNLTWHSDLWNEAGVSVKIGKLYPTRKLHAWFMFNPGGTNGSTRHYPLTKGVTVLLRLTEDRSRLLNGKQLRTAVDKIGAKLQEAMRQEAQEATKVADQLGKLTTK